MYNDFAKFVGKNFLREVFASEKEITDNFEASYYNDLNKKDNNIKTFNKGGIPLYYKDNNVYAQSKEDHTLIFGASGSGKTRALIFPLIYNLANNNENMVISDIKGEIHETMSGYLKDKGYNVLVFNLKDPTHSLKFSFLHTPYHLIRDNPNDEESVAKGEELLTDLSHTLLAGSRNNNSEGSKDPYWDNAAQRTVLAALLILIYNADSEDECNFYNLALIIDALAGERDDENSSDLLDKYYDNLPRNSSIKSNLGVVITNAKGSQTRQCIISCARNLIDIFTSNPLIASILNQTEINFNDFNGENKKTALFVIVPDDKTSYNSIFAMMVTQLYQTLLYELVPVFLG